MEVGYKGIATTVRERRTINDFNGQPVSKEVLIELLNDAVWAPFHSKTEPWRFILFHGDGRRQFSDAVLRTYSQEKREQYADRVSDTYCNVVPVHLLVLIREELRQKEWEEAFAAASALIQNLQLLAWERKIGVVWKTNDYNENSEFREGTGVKPGEKVVGTLHMGYFDPKKVRRAKPRTPAETLITWVDS
ncbi:nitroreductase [Cohnella abietis]|uniref:Putative NAD(P)H nitroreductase n=2 Tax=Cohnella abietis TaxID=2507935 RepID=A0A3T1D5R3_9BACL|nr:nitroreductase [Cohnella abietis]